VGPQSDPRLCRALEAWPPRVSSAQAGSANKFAVPSQARPQSDGSDWVRYICLYQQRMPGTLAYSLSRTSVGEERPAIKLV
jgi:hypothetical protein